MHTAVPGTFLAHICEMVCRMKPGERLSMDRHSLAEIHSFDHNGATFTSADRVLGNIIGSAWTHSFRIDPITGTVTFERHEDTGGLRYVSPDHR